MIATNIQPLILLPLLSVIILASTLHPPSLRAATAPSCFPSGPACLRPQLEECRDAIRKMRYTDPGVRTLLGRHVSHFPHSISLPRTWHSAPRNCVVKLDVTNDDARDGLRLQFLTTPAEEILKACVTEGTKCGGSLLVGKLKVLELSVGYYTAVRLEALEEEAAAAVVNGTVRGEWGILRLNGSRTISEDML